MEDDLNFLKVEDDLNFFKMEDNHKLSSLRFLQSNHSFWIQRSKYIYTIYKMDFWKNKQNNSMQILIYFSSGQVLSIAFKILWICNNKILTYQASCSVWVDFMWRLRVKFLENVFPQMLQVTFLGASLCIDNICLFKSDLRLNVFSHNSQFTDERPSMSSTCST